MVVTFVPAMATVFHRSNLTKERMVLAPSKRFQSALVRRHSEQLGLGWARCVHALGLTILRWSCLGESVDSGIHEPTGNLTQLPGLEAQSQVM